MSLFTLSLDKSINLKVLLFKDASLVDFQPVTLNKKMLFLLSKSDSIRQVETYLKKREWEVVITTSLKEAIINVITLKPSYFFISYDFPNKKALALARALEHQTSVVLTGEVAKSQNIKSIQDHSTKYKLPPPISGPAVERVINRITKDLENQDEEIAENIKRGTVTKEQENIIKIRSSFMKEGGDGESYVQTGGGIGALLSSMGGDTGPSYSNDQFDSDDSPTYSSRENTNEQDRADQERAAKMFEEAAAHHGDADSDLPPELSLAELSKLTPQDFEAAMEKLKKKSKKSGRVQADEENGFDGELEEKVKKDFEKLKRSAIARRQRKYQGSDYGTNDENDPRARIRKEKTASSEKMTILETGTHEAVDKTLTANSNEGVKAELKTSTRVACIMVESARFQGYLLVAFGNDRVVDMTLIDQMKQKLFSFLKDNGEKASENESMDLKMTEVGFEDWALEHAEFLKSTSHQGQEIAVAFFPSTTKFAALQEQTKLKKYELSIEELRGDLIVEFDLYLHLEVNDKLLLYTPQGRPFYSTQKDRLKTKGISNLYINQESANDLKKYRVQNYLNDKIAEFKNKKKES